MTSGHSPWATLPSPVARSSACPWGEDVGNTKAEAHSPEEESKGSVTPGHILVTPSVRTGLLLSDEYDGTPEEDGCP